MAPELISNAFRPTSSNNYIYNTHHNSNNKNASNLVAITMHYTNNLNDGRLQQLQLTWLCVWHMDFRFRFSFTELVARRLKIKRLLYRHSLKHTQSRKFYVGIQSQIAVTFAPQLCASCTARLPNDVAASMISTVSPNDTRPRYCNAM